MNWIDFAFLSLTGTILWMINGLSGAQLEGPAVSTRCEEYAKTAATTSTPLKSAVLPANSKTRTLLVELPNGPPEPMLMETPSRAIWLPKCRTIQNGEITEYDPMQMRVNGEKFCVYTTTGAILFDPFAAARGSKRRVAPFQCDCFDKRKAYSYMRGAPDSSSPVCNATTGAWLANRNMWGTIL